MVKTDNNKVLDVNAGRMMIRAIRTLLVCTCLWCGQTLACRRYIQPRARWRNFHICHRNKNGQKPSLCPWRRSVLELIPWCVENYSWLWRSESGGFYHLMSNKNTQGHSLRIFKAWTSLKSVPLYSEF